MDIDSLLPPRYAIESDDEDEFDALPHNRLPAETKIKVEITGNVPQNANLVIAAGVAGKAWARGEKLDKQSGEVSVNGVQIGLVYNPYWTKSNIIVSEVFSGLPLHAMHPYAETIINSLKPLSVSLLDSYPVPTYVTAHPVPFHDAPIRYLSTSSPQLDLSAELFTPPNLIQATSASFLSILSVKDIVGTLILLPSPYIALSPPKQVFPSNLLRLSEDAVEWSTSLMQTAQNLLFQALGEPIQHAWEYVDAHQDKITKQRTEVGEGGMYL